MNFLSDALDNYIDVKAEEPRIDEYYDENRAVCDFPLDEAAMNKVEDWVRNIDVSQTVTIDGIDNSENVVIKPMGYCSRPQDVETLQTKQSSPPGSSRAMMKKRVLRIAGNFSR